MGSNEDINICLYLEYTQSPAYSGILRIHARRNTQAQTPAPDKMKWLVRDGFAAADVIAVVSGTTIDFYVNNNGGNYNYIGITVLSERGRTQFINPLTAVSSTSPTTGLTPSAVSS